MAVTNKTYTELLALIQSKFGAGSLESVEQTSVLNLVNNRAYEAYQSSANWPRYLVTAEPRSIENDQVVPYDEDAFNVVGAGTTAANGFYQYNRFYDEQNKRSYVLNGSAISFTVSGLTEGNGTYKFNPNIGNGDGGWQNQDEGQYVFRVPQVNDQKWDFVDNTDGSPQYVASDITFFPWQSNWGVSPIKFSGQPEDAYVLRKHASNNHWEIVKESSNATSVVLYKNGNGNSPSETAWTNDQTSGVHPSPLVFDLDSIMEFVRVHRNRPFLNNSTIEYDFYVNDRGANLMNVFPTDSGVAYVSYKKEFVALDTNSDIPREWFFFIAHGVYADLLRIEGRTEEGIAEETIAQNYLSLEMEKVNNMNNNNILRKFSTHVSSQSRSI